VLIGTVDDDRRLTNCGGGQEVIEGEPPGQVHIVLTVITHAGGRVDFRGNPGAELEFPVGSRSITSRRALRNRAALTVLRQQQLDGRHPE
jgi:hypothetical protein